MSMIRATLLGCKVEKLHSKLVRLGQDSDNAIRALEATASNLAAEKERLVSDQDWAENIVGSLRVGISACEDTGHSLICKAVRQAMNSGIASGVVLHSEVEHRRGFPK